MFGLYTITGLIIIACAILYPKEGSADAFEISLTSLARDGKVYNQPKQQTIKQANKNIGLKWIRQKWFVY